MNQSRRTANANRPSRSLPALTPRHLTCILHGMVAWRCPCNKVRLTTRLRRVHEIDERAQAIFNPSPSGPTTGDAKTADVLSFPLRVRRLLRPLVFGRFAHDVFTIQTAWNVRRTLEYHCLLYGERTPEALIVRVIIDDTMAEKDRELFQNQIASEGYVLLGQADDHSEDYLPQEDRPEDYVYLITTNIDGIDQTTCQSTNGDQIITHPVGIIEESEDFL